MPKMLSERNGKEEKEDEEKKSKASGGIKAFAQHPHMLQRGKLLAVLSQYRQLQISSLRRVIDAMATLLYRIVRLYVSCFFSFFLSRFKT